MAKRELSKYLLNKIDKLTKAKAGKELYKTLAQVDKVFHKVRYALKGQSSSVNKIRRPLSLIREYMNNPKIYRIQNVKEIKAKLKYARGLLSELGVNRVDQVISDTRIAQIAYEQHLKNWVNKIESSPELFRSRTSKYGRKKILLRDNDKQRIVNDLRGGGTAEMKANFYRKLKNKQFKNLKF